MGIDVGAEARPSANQDLFRQIKRAQRLQWVRGGVVGIVVASASVAFLFGGIVASGAAASRSRTSQRAPGASADQQAGLASVTQAASKVASPATSVVLAAPAAGRPSVGGPGAVNPVPVHTSLSASGPSATGRTFSYGYDMAQQGPYVSAGAPAQAARQVAQSIGGSFEDVPIMGWGVGSPEPSPGIFDFSQIAKRIAFVQSTGGIPVITLCASPDWMKGGQPGVTDWSQIDVAPVPQHFQDFATLSAAIAKAFPQVKYFVVWNEMKGFWDQSTNSWDAAGYTSLYNDVFSAIKTVRPDALVGGPYVSMESSSGPSTSSPATPSGPWGHLDPTSLAAVSYWLAHKTGADFIAVDGRAFTSNAGFTSDPLTSTEKYAAVDIWLTGQTSLPIVWMESHILPAYVTATQQQQAALRIAVLLQMASSGASVGLQWNPEEDAGWDEGLWTSSDGTGGGAPTTLAQELPGVLGVLAAPVSLLSGEPVGTLVASGADGTVTVHESATAASVVVTGPTS
jgi:hypothetical protein